LLNIWGNVLNPWPALSIPHQRGFNGAHGLSSFESVLRV
jgi:hypothetical protein